MLVESHNNKLEILKFSRALAHRTNAAVKASYRSFLGNEYTRSSYSQYGEDIILRALFARYPEIYKGFYVDVGAHHPLKYSNSNLFYELGWRGICIDPIPGGKLLFYRKRKKDLFIEFGVSETERVMNYYMYDQPAYNTFSEEIANSLPIQYKGIVEVNTLPLHSIFNQYLPINQIIDFISIDAEGMDLQVLRSNDWNRYRPKIVVIENMEAGNLDKIESLPENTFMISSGYLAIARTPSAIYFVDSHSPCFDGGPFLKYL